MIHQLERVLLIWVVRHNVCDSQEAKSKSFLIRNYFSWVKTPKKRDNIKNDAILYSLSYQTCTPNSVDAKHEVRM